MPLDPVVRRGRVPAVFGTETVVRQPLACQKPEGLPNLAPVTPEPEPQAPAGTVRWGLGDAALAFVVGIFAESILGTTVEEAVGHRSLLAVAAGLFGLWLGIGGVAIWACRTKGSGRLADDYGLRVAGPLDAVAGIAVGLVSQVILVPILYAPWVRLQPSVRDTLEKPAKELVDLVEGNWGVVALTLLVVVGAPIVEELFFRGLLLRALQRRLGPAPAVVISAVLFGLAHFEGVQLPALVVFGLVLGYLAVRTDRLGPGIFAHMAFNAVTVFSLVHAR